MSKNFCVYLRKDMSHPMQSILGFFKLLGAGVVLLIVMAFMCTAGVITVPFIFVNEKFRKRKTQRQYN